MKKYGILFLGVLVNIFSAQEKFDCYTINENKVLSKYHSLKHLRADYITPTGAEVVPMLLSVFDDGDIRQICIDASYKNYRLGTEKQYQWYKEYVKNISESDFYKNYDYLMIFQEIVFKLEQTTNYKRMRKSASYSSYSDDTYHTAGLYKVKANGKKLVYFYRTPNLNDRKKSYFNTPEKVMVVAVQNGFGYVDFTNSRNQKSSGWVRLSDMEKQY